MCTTRSTPHEEHTGCTLEHDTFQNRPRSHAGAHAFPASRHKHPHARAVRTCQRCRRATRRGETPYTHALTAYVRRCTLQGFTRSANIFYAPNFPHGVYKRHPRSSVPYPSGATDLRAQATNNPSVSPYPQKFWSGITRSSSLNTHHKNHTLSKQYGTHPKESLRSPRLKGQYLSPTQPPLT